MLAASADAEVRDPQGAVQWAERAVALTARRDADALDALGAAYASSGRFDEAIAAARSALDLTTAAGARERADQIRARLELYRRRQPFHESPTRP